MNNPTIDFRHVTIFHSDDGAAWCQFFLKFFQQPDLHLRVETLNLNSLSYVNPPEIQVSLKESYVTLVLMTAGVIDYMEEKSKWLSKMFTQCELEVNSVVAIPCHVEMDDITGMCKEKNYDNSSWDFIEVEMNGSNVSEIISRALRWVDGNKMRRNNTLSQSKALLSSAGFCEIFPSEIQQIGGKIAVVFKGDIKGEITMIIRKREVVLEMINPYCAVFTIPELPIGKHSAIVFVDGELKAKCRLNYKPFTPNSLTLLMETFNVNKKEDMDSLLAEKYIQSVCDDPLLMNIEQNLNPSTESKKNIKYPSLIHWAAENGLKELCSQMMMSPGAASICAILNHDNQHAADLARINDHLELEEYISDFLETQLYVDACGLYVQTHGDSDDDVYEKVEAYPKKKAHISPIRHTKSVDVPPPVKPRNRSQSVSTVHSKPAVVPKPLAIDIKLSDAAVGCRSQNELIDIMEDFKTGNFNLGEVDMLFKGWKTRYETGNAISFKDKQRMLMDFQMEHKNIFAMKRTKGFKGPENATIKEEDDNISISVPIVPRRTAVGLSSNRIQDAPLRGSEAGTESSASSASYDSGRGSDQSLLSGFGQEEEFNSKRKSCAQIFNDLREQVQEQIAPPPLPPRKQKTKKVYSRPK